MNKTIDQLNEHRRSMTAWHGNIGCGASWLCINGVQIADSDLADVARDDADPHDADDIRRGLVKSHHAPRRRAT